jgi:hypothetical protein
VFCSKYSVLVFVHPTRSPRFPPPGIGSVAVFFHQLLADFNYDYRVEDTGAEGVQAAIARWNDANAETRRILEAIEADD